MKQLLFSANIVLHGRAICSLCVFLLVVMAFPPMPAMGQNNQNKGGSSFDGFWPKTQRQHTDCSYFAKSDIMFSTNAAGVTIAVCDALGVTKGKVEGRTYVFDYGIVNGVPSGKGIFTLDDCGSFTGTFSDVNGHRGNWTGKRGGSPFDGFWPKTQRQHTDCPYSAKSDITFSTNAAGVTIAVCDALGVTKGKVEGRTYVFDYGILNGAPSGKGTFTLDDDCRSFTGTFSDVNGHRGNWSGKR